MNFTSSPFERMMKEKPRPQAPAENRPPRGSACYGCCYWRGIACVSCYKELLKAGAGGRLTIKSQAPKCKNPPTDRCP